MSIKTAIAWTDHTFNPWWGCVKVDPGCAHCYAETFARARLGLDIWGPGSQRRTFGDKHWREPLLWNKKSQLALGRMLAGIEQAGHAHRVFCGSMCDWAEDHPTAAAVRPQLWDLIRRTPFLDWQLLTKRAHRISACLPPDWGAGWPNVWLGVSVSEPKGLWRVDELLQVPAEVRFLSYEPALGDISTAPVLDGLDWIIFGGESGPGYRAPIGWQDWARALRDRCRRANVAFFFKQSPAVRTEMGTQLDGETVREFPQ
jgi:protein gp37